MKQAPQLYARIIALCAARIAARDGGDERLAAAVKIPVARLRYYAENQEVIEPTDLLHGGKAWAQALKMSMPTFTKEVVAAFAPKPTALTERLIAHLLQHEMSMHEVSRLTDVPVRVVREALYGASSIRYRPALQTFLGVTDEQYQTLHLAVSARKAARTEDVQAHTDVWSMTDYLLESIHASGLTVTDWCKKADLPHHRVFELLHGQLKQPLSPKTISKLGDVLRLAPEIVAIAVRKIRPVPERPLPRLQALVAKKIDEDGRNFREICQTANLPGDSVRLLLKSGLLTSMKPPNLWNLRLFLGIDRETWYALLAEAPPAMLARAAATMTSAVPEDREELRMLGLWRKVGPETRAQVMQILRGAIDI